MKKAEALLAVEYDKVVTVYKRNFYDENDLLCKTVVSYQRGARGGSTTEILGNVTKGPEGSISCTAHVDGCDPKNFVGMNSPAEAEAYVMGEL